MSSPIAFQGKTAWITAFIIALVFLMPVLAISLPSVTLPGMRVMDVTSLRTPTYAESNPARILAENNWTLWNLGAGQGGFTLNYSESGLLLSGSLPPSSEPSAFSISRHLSVNVTEYPIMYMLVDVTPSAGYGIRFYSNRLGLETPLWSESDALNHRSGTGQSENIQVNMLQLTGLNTGRIYDSTSSVTVYLERGASSKSTPFSLQIKKFEFLDFPLVSASMMGSYHALYVGLGQIQQTPSLSLRSVQVQGRVNASVGTLIVAYFINGLFVYQGPVYSITNTPVEISISIALTSQTAKSFSDNLPRESAAIVLVTASGILSQLTVEHVSLNYYSKVVETSPTTAKSRNGLLNDAFFFVVLPASVLILLYSQLKTTRTRRTSCDSALQTNARHGNTV